MQCFCVCVCAICLNRHICSAFVFLFCAFCLNTQAHTCAVLCICITLVIFCRTRISLRGLVLHLQCIGSHCCTCNANLCTGLKLRCIGERQTPSARRCTALHCQYTWLKRRSNERALSRDKVIPAHSGLVTKPRLDSQQRPIKFFLYFI